MDSFIITIQGETLLTLPVLQKVNGKRKKYSIFGVLQPFSDALKLVVKETIVPAQANKVLFYLAPMMTLIFSLLGLN